MQSSLVVIWFAMLAVAVECRNGSSSDSDAGGDSSINSRSSRGSGHGSGSGSNSDAARNSSLQSTSNDGRSSIHNKSNNSNGDTSNESSSDDSSDIGQDSSSDIAVRDKILKWHAVIVENASKWQTKLDKFRKSFDKQKVKKKDRKFEARLTKHIPDLAVKKLHYFAVRAVDSQRLDYYRLDVAGVLALLDVVVVAFDNHHNGKLDNHHNGKRYLVVDTDIHKMYVVDTCIDKFICHLKAINNKVVDGTRLLFNNLQSMGFQGKEVLEMRVSHNWNKLLNNDLASEASPEASVDLIDNDLASEESAATNLYSRVLDNFHWVEGTGAFGRAVMSMANGLDSKAITSSKPLLAVTDGKVHLYLYLMSNYGWFQRTNAVTKYWSSLANSLKITYSKNNTDKSLKPLLVTASIANGSKEVQFKYEGNVIPLMLVNIPEKYDWRHELRLYDKSKGVMYDLQVVNKTPSGVTLNVSGVTKLSSEAKKKTSEDYYLKMFYRHVSGRGGGDNYFVLDFLQPLEETLDKVYLTPNGLSVTFNTPAFSWNIPSCPLSIPMLQQLSQQPPAKCKDYFYDGQIKKVNAAIL